MKSICILGKQSNNLLRLQREINVSPLFFPYLQQAAEVRKVPKLSLQYCGAQGCSGGNPTGKCSLLGCCRQAVPWPPGWEASGGCAGCRRGDVSCGSQVSPALPSLPRLGVRGGPSRGPAAVCLWSELPEIVTPSQDLIRFYL